MLTLARLHFGDVALCSPLRARLVSPDSQPQQYHLGHIRASVKKSCVAVLARVRKLFLSLPARQSIFTRVHGLKDLETLQDMRLMLQQPSK
jgi:hypothetical protein